uniref:Uncharacterized protein n=1 Tax=Schlesneria paludicola TaxID=360056 RepID=A0A7C2P0S0_9PLAN
MSRQPGWVRTIARRMDSSDAQREEFLAVAEKAFAAGERRRQAADNPLPLDEILAPLRAPSDAVRTAQSADETTVTR